MTTRDRVESFLQSALGVEHLHRSGRPNLSAIAKALGLSRERVSAALGRPYKEVSVCWCGMRISPRRRACDAHMIPKARRTWVMGPGGMYPCRWCGRLTLFEDFVTDRNRGKYNGGKLTHCKRCAARARAIRFDRTQQRKVPFKPRVHLDLANDVSDAAGKVPQE